MNLTGIIAISGKPGLYKVVAQGKNNIIVESLEDKKRFPAYASNRISALDDISIYTYEEDKPLKDIFQSIFDKEKGGAAISHKEDAKKQAAYLSEVLPDYDKERVYPSDIKKLFQWYNLLQKVGELKPDASADGEEETKKTAKKAGAKAEGDDKSADAPKTEKKAVAEKKAPAVKKPAAAKTAAPKATGKATAAKKAPAKTGGTSRGK